MGASSDYKIASEVVVVADVDVNVVVRTVRAVADVVIDNGCGIESNPSTPSVPTATHPLKSNGDNSPNPFGTKVTLQPRQTVVLLGI